MVWLGTDSDYVLKALNTQTQKCSQSLYENCISFELVQWALSYVFHSYVMSMFYEFYYSLCISCLSLCVLCFTWLQDLFPNEDGRPNVKVEAEAEAQVNVSLMDCTPCSQPANIWLEMADTIIYTQSKTLLNLV